MNQRSFVLMLGAVALTASGLLGQVSPRQTATATIGGKAVSVDYGAPSVRGRKVMGELVPFGQVWRLGANKATHLTTETDLVIGNLTVPAGTYTLFALPDANGWKLIVNRRTGQWGIPYKPEYNETELGRVDMKVGKTSAPVEQMKISLDGGMLMVEWENTRAAVGVKAK